MSDLKEVRITPGFTPTDHQRMVLAKIVSSATDKIAGEEVSRSEKLVTARDILADIGVITYTMGRASITPKGEQMMKDEGITDEMGKLTDQGEKWSRKEYPKEESYQYIVEKFARHHQFKSLVRQTIEEGQMKNILIKFEENVIDKLREFFDLTILRKTDTHNYVFHFITKRWKFKPTVEEIINELRRDEQFKQFFVYKKPNRVQDFFNLYYNENEEPPLK